MNVRHVPALICALLPILFWRVDAMFPDKDFSTEVHDLSCRSVLDLFSLLPRYWAQDIHRNTQRGGKFTASLDVIETY